MAELTYNPDIFDAPDEQAARRIILTAEGGLSTDERWVRETPLLVELAAATLAITAASLILDFGCGIGRLSKALIERFGCRVLGVDLSMDMRAMAPRYVASDLFSVVSPKVFRSMVASGLRVQGAATVWVLQHCLNPAAEIETIATSLQPGAAFMVVNNIHRAVPTREMRWASDGADVRQMLRSRFTETAAGKLDPQVVSQALSEHTYWAAYR